MPPNGSRFAGLGVLALALFGALALPAAGHASDGSGGVNTGVDHTCAIDAADEIKCWGTDQGGSVNDPNAETGKFKAINSTWYHTCAIDAAAEIECWGLDSGGPTNGSVSGPNAETGKFKAIGTGFEHTCAIDAADEIECWGE